MKHFEARNCESFIKVVSSLDSKVYTEYFGKSGDQIKKSNATSS